MGENLIISKLQVKNLLSFAGILGLVVLIDFLFRIYINYHTAKKIYTEKK